MLCMLLWRHSQLCRVHAVCSESWNSPPLLCCCGSWDCVSTRRLCPMIQPLRGLYLSCTQKQQLHLPSSFFKNVLSPLSGCLLLLCILFVCPSSIPFPSVLPPSLPHAISLRPSLPPGAGLSLPLAQWPSLLGSQHWSAFTKRCLPFLRGGWVVFGLILVPRYVV